MVGYALRAADAEQVRVLYKQSNQLDRPFRAVETQSDITAEAALKGEITTGLLPGGKAEITLKAGASIEVELEGKDMADIMNQVVSLTIQLATSLANKLRERLRRLQKAFEILNLFFRR